MQKVFALSAMAAVAVASSKSKIQVLYESLENFNLGCMKAMQANPDDSGNGCTTAVANTNAEIVNMFDWNNFTTGEFELNEFLDYWNVFNIKVIEQNTACGTDQYIMKFDQIFSTWAGLGGALANLAIQLGTGYDPMSTGSYVGTTQVYKGWNMLAAGWAAVGADGEKDWLQIGEGLGLIFTSLPKAEINESTVQVDTVDG